ncbi:uncharacterized protein B0H18DRAFT_1118009 [Fomitopsis serialis]|uniref:uncharacterized protein n=1 Tax=Fomitopsis serialis TaxID=139415 RepID=UPI002008737D|nr:uncharacterized protein B0H18DRAFT_1118009 [Neoantrodia serialis]KAH9928329.1 hypothetical protein B0H18DRAFT_1118009 [Neoantrodia serialis]
MNSSRPYVVLYSPTRRDFAIQAGGRKVSKKTRPCLVTALEGDEMWLAPLLTAREHTKMNPFAWSIVDYGRHGPHPPSSPDVNAATFVIPLRRGRTRRWKPTSCFVWTRDAGQLVSVSEFRVLQARGRAAVLDTDFALDAVQMERLRIMHHDVGIAELAKAGWE